MAATTIALLVIVYVLSVSVNLIQFDKTEAFDKPLRSKEEKILLILMFTPFVTTFFALLGVTINMCEIIRKIEFKK